MHGCTISDATTGFTLCRSNNCAIFFVFEVFFGLVVMVLLFKILCEIKLPQIQTFRLRLPLAVLPFY